MISFFIHLFIQMGIQTFCARLSFQYRKYNAEQDRQDHSLIFLFFLFSYNCLYFLPIPPPHPSQSHFPPPTSTLPLDFVLVSFIVAPIDPSPHYPHIKNITRDIEIKNNVTIARLLFQCSVLHPKGRRERKPNKNHEHDT